MQVYLFPLVVLAFFFLGRTAIRPPLWGLALIFIFWGFSGLKVYGYLPSFSEGVYLSKLSDDPQGSEAELIRHGSWRIAKKYDLPKVNLLLRDVNSSEDRESLLGEDKFKSLLLLSGDSKWLNVLLSDNFLKFLPGAGSSSTGLSLVENNSFSEEAKVLIDEFKLMEKSASKFSKAIPVYEKDFSRLFFLSTGPGEFQLYNSKDYLTDFYISWLAHAFRSGDQGGPEELRPQAKRGLLEASELSGLWKSPIPRGMSRFLLGSAEVALGSKIGQRDLLACGLANLLKAAGFTPARSSKELRAAILNNAAISHIFSAEDEALFTEARDWLWMAANFRDRNGEAFPSAKIAYFNMIQLERTKAVRF